MSLAQSYPARARFKFGEGRFGEARNAADSPAGIVGGRGKFAAFFLGADIPALLRTGALEALGGQLGCARNVLTLGEMGVDVPLKVNGMGRFVLSPGLFGMGRKKSARGPTHWASYFFLAFPKKRPNFPRADCAFVMRGMACIGSIPRAPSRHASRRGWEMRRIRVCRTPEKLPRNCP